MYLKIGGLQNACTELLTAWEFYTKLIKLCLMQCEVSQQNCNYIHLIIREWERDKIRQKQ